MDITSLITAHTMTTPVEPLEWLPTADVLFSAQNIGSGNATAEGFVWLNINTLTSMSFTIDDPGRPATGQAAYWLRP